MNANRFAYLCNQCRHCVVLDVCKRRVAHLCPLCLETTVYNLNATVVDHGEYEEWTRI